MSPEQHARRWCFRTLAPVAQWAGIKTTAPEFRAGLVLLASVKYATTDPDRLSQLTGVAVETIQRIAARARKQRLWHGGRVRAKWMDEEMSDWAFVLDVMAVTRDLVRVPDPVATAKRKRQRAARKAAGQCLNCGRAWEGPQTTCATCRASMAKSQKRPVDHSLRKLTDVEPYYGLEQWTKAEDQP